MNHPAFNASATTIKQLFEDHAPENIVTMSDGAAIQAVGPEGTVTFHYPIYNAEQRTLYVEESQRDSAGTIDGELLVTILGDVT